MNEGTVFDGTLWYVVHTKPKEELRAERNLNVGGVETFTPLIKETRANRNSPAIKPLFPRYLFARFNASEMLHKISFTRGVQGLVKFGGTPVPVADEIIDLIASRMGEDGFVRVGDELKSGDRVRISDGPFKNFVGIFERHMKQSDRVMVLLMMVNYQSHINIEKGLVRKINGQDEYDMASYGVRSAA